MICKTRWYAEKTAAFLSAAVATVEVDPVKAKLFQQMADAAEQQAAILAKGLEAKREFEPPRRARLVAWLIGVLGPRAIRPILSASKVRGVSVYSGPAHRLGHPMPKSVEEVGRSHRGAGGGTLRAGIFGANDGLVSNT